MNFDSPTPEVAVGYMKQMFQRLLSVGVEINTMLDVGAAHGHFSGFFETFYPDAEITAVECNERDSYFLSKYPNWETHYMCLGEKKCVKDFYLDKKEMLGGGSSMYLEDTAMFDDKIVEKKEITTIDDEFEDRVFDFIKIDTQGSELDILKGGERVVSKAKWLLLELSFLEFNKGAPLIDDVLAYTREKGWRMYDTIGPLDGGHMYQEIRGLDMRTCKLQVDVLLKRCERDELQLPRSV